MTQIDTKQLLLQVDASIELLKKNMAAGERTVAEFELEAERQLNKLEARFSGFKGEGLNNSMRAVAQDFKKNFTDIQKIAAQAIELPPLKGGGLNLGAADAKAAADQAQKQAMAINLVVASLERQALATGTLSVAEETQLRAAKAAAAAAEQNAVALRQEAGALERLEMDLAATSAQQGIFNAQTRRATVSTGQMRAAQQQLTYNLGDAVTMWGLGAKPMQIFISQASQVTGAIGLMTNSTKGFVAFLGGPWTQVLLAAITILTVMTAGDDKAAASKKKHADAADALKDAVDRLNNASAAANHTTRQGIIDDLNKAEAMRQRELATRRTLIAEQQLARERLTENLAASKRAAQTGDIGARGAAGGSSVLASSDERRIADIESSIREQNAKIIQADQAKVNAAGLLLDRDARGRIDPRERINQNYDDARDRARREFERTGNGTAYSSALTRAERTKAAQEKALEKGRTGPSAETIRQREISNDISFNQQLLQARRQLLDATAQSTTSELERDQLLKEEINAEADAARTKIQLQQSKGQISEAEAQQLLTINEAIRSQRLANVAQDRIRATIDAQFTATQHSTDAEIAMLRIKEDMAVSNAERRSIARMILEKEQQAALEQLAHIVSTSKSQAEIDQALADRAALLKRQKAERENFDAQPNGPLDQYRRDIATVGANLNENYQQVAVDGLRRLNDGLADAIVNAKGFGDVFSDVAKQVIADLIRIAVQQLIVNQLVGALGGAFGLGGGGGLTGARIFSEQSTVGSVPKIFGFSGGGYTGDGSPTDIAGPVHKKEFVFDASATSRIGVPTLEALRRGTYRGPAISTSRIAGGSAGSGMARVQLELSGDIDARIDRRSQNVAIDVIRAAAPTIQRAAVGETISTLNRRQL